MNDEEHNLVQFGTPFEPIEEDEVPKKKPIRIEDQIVTDEKGRRRFHGAFTGGFSAGYFNTVGTKEGWTPSTFVSSRSKKAESFAQSALDIMDEEDKGAHGISHQAVRVTSHYDNDTRKRPANPSFREGPIPGEPALSSLILPSSETIGMFLLKKMGWKLGQGIGPRLKYKEKKKRKSQSVRDKSRKFGSEASESSNSEDEEITKGHTFAPNDIDCLPYTPKGNLHGLGYKGLDKSEFQSGHINLFGPPTTSAVMKNKSRLSITGQAFGVGAFEDDDDDIYAKDDMSRYDFMLGAEVKSDKKKQSQSSSNRSIPGFHISSRKKNLISYFRPPELPKNFKPVHKNETRFNDESHKGLDRHSLSAQARRFMINDDTAPKSVFDLVSAEDKAKLSAARMSKADSREEPSKSLPEIIQPVNIMAGGFKPFKMNTEKQKRYEAFIDMMRAGRTDELVSIQPSSMTEWEREREKDEFVRAVHLYKPLNSAMASRFTSAKHHDDETKIEISIDKIDDRSDDMKAAEMKMFGKMTRKSFEWHPNRILCKRFNIPDPYPGCETSGLPKVQKEKVSLFSSFLTASNNEDISTPDQKQQSREPATTNASDNQKEKTNTQAAHERTTEPSDEDLEEKEIKRPSIDIFKAIFASDESDSSDDSDSNHMDNTSTKPHVEAVLQKVSQNPASGVFANIDLDAVNEAPSHIRNEQSESNLKADEVPIVKEKSPPIKYYGPALPPADAPQQHKVKKKKKNKEKKKKKGKHKSKNDRKKKKSKHKKHISSDSEDSDSDEDNEVDNRDIAMRLKRIGGTLRQFL